MLSLRYGLPVVTGRAGYWRYPLGREWWNEEVRQSIYSQEFVSIISDSPDADVEVKLTRLRDSQSHADS